MKTKINFDLIKTFAPYILSGLLILGLVFVGTIDKNSSNQTISLNTFTSDDFTVSTDQVSEMYIVADLSSALNLASSEAAASNYMMSSTMYRVGQTTADKAQKAIILETPFTRGVNTYIVAAGDTMADIASRNGLTTDQIRWSNGLKTTALSAGDTLYLPSVAGIVYTVKANDTLQTIASTYGSSVDEIMHLNDLEITGLSEGLKIVIKNGVLPETERPEYVAPVYYYSYSGRSAERSSSEFIMSGFGSYNGYGWGQCTSWAWYKRQDLPAQLGDAKYWAYNAAAKGFPVDNVPAPDAIFQYDIWPYGHVGYVEDVFQDGSILITEANYNWQTGVVTRSIVPANVAATYSYIHRK